MDLHKADLSYLFVIDLHVADLDLSLKVRCGGQGYPTTKCYGIYFAKESFKILDKTDHIVYV